MADDSPGKVQALRAIFSEKNKPLMGMMPPGTRISNRTWKRASESEENLVTLKEKHSSESILHSRAITKVLPFPAKKLDAINGESHREVNSFNDKNSNKCNLKPVIGPKPSHLLQQGRTNSSLNVNTETSDVNENGDVNENERCLNLNNGQEMLKSQAKSKAFAETIASFMFTNGAHNKENDNISPVDNKKSIPPIPKPRTSQMHTNMQNQMEVMNICNSHSVMLPKKDMGPSCCNLINSDNYVCKSNCKFRRKELPTLEELGPPPPKPVKPHYLKLPAKFLMQPFASNSPVQFLQSTEDSAPTLPQRPAPQKPSYPCPPRPLTPPPLPPILAPVIQPQVSLREEIEELYEDTLLGENGRRPVSLIPEYTEEEEQAEELYNDAGEADDVPTCPVPLPTKPKNPPPPCPSEYLQPNVHGSNEELYQDADGPIQEEFYEEMPCDIIPEDSGSPLYSNNRKEIEKLRREEEKRIRKEQKEKEKKGKEMEKLKKKFGLTGEEIPIDDGLVKADSRGGKGDLAVKRGETVLILRMEGNPSGRWLVKNEKGKVGYVELTNIEVDPLSVKSVMAIRRMSVISSQCEELYSEAKSEEEAIYEETY
ncbi:FYN-binding protein, partial [Stegodyphus mimosarum]